MKLESNILTIREKEILQALFDSDDNMALVAEKLVISINTIKTHRDHIFKKFFVSSISGAFRAGLALNLINLPMSLETHPPLILQKI